LQAKQFKNNDKQFKVIAAQILRMKPFTTDPDQSTGQNVSRETFCPVILG
jgi:hypothetical protein